MGCFDSLMITCPMCGEVNEMQVKPVFNDNYGGTYDLSSAPAEVLQNAAYMNEFCDCGCVLSIVHDRNEDLNSNRHFALRVAKDFPIGQLPKRIKFVEES